MTSEFCCFRYLVSTILGGFFLYFALMFNTMRTCAMCTNLFTMFVHCLSILIMTLDFLLTATTNTHTHGGPRPYSVDIRAI